MIMDCNQYRINVEPIRKLLGPKSEQERFEFIATLAVVTGVPIIVVCCYVGELYGFSAQLYTKIARLKQFYTIDTVLNANGGYQDV